MKNGIILKYEFIISFKEGTFNYRRDFYNNLEQLILLLLITG